MSSFSTTNVAKKNLVKEDANTRANGHFASMVVRRISDIEQGFVSRKSIIEMSM